MWMKYLVLAVGGSVELQEGTGGVVWAAGVKHAVDLRYRRNTLVEKIQSFKRHNHQYSDESCGEMKKAG